jgi:hypothetical protein
MARDALVSLVMPAGLVADGGLFARSRGARRAATTLALACIVIALLFFASPPFRQAFDVALGPWLGTFRAASADPQHSIRALAQKAEVRHDAEGLAFCAVRLNDPAESLPLARDAVKLDRNLEWIYGVLALRVPSNPEVLSAVAALAASDPQNSLLHLVSAESVKETGIKTPSSAWQDEMAAAFASTRFDDYSERIPRLTRVVIPRYGAYDPYEVESRDAPAPQFLLQNTQAYAELLLSQGGQAELDGDGAKGRERYWTVAKFGQMFDSQAHSPFEHSIGTRLQAMAYGRLAESSSRNRNNEQAAMFMYLAAKMGGPGPAAGEAGREESFGRETAMRNAAVVEISGLMMLAFLFLALAAGVILIFAAREQASVAAQRARPIAVMVLLASSLGVLFSAATLYVTYRPYWYIFRAATLSGERVPTQDLREFLGFMQVLPGVPHRLSMLVVGLAYSGSPGFLFYVWAGTVLLAVLGLGLIVWRRFAGRRTPPPK